MTDVQYGTVLVFREDVTKKQAEKALELLTGLLDPNYTYASKGGKAPIYEFDPNYGGPVWYCP